MSNRSFHTARGSNNGDSNSGSELANENVENLQAYIDPPNAELRYIQHVENEYDRLSGLLKRMNRDINRLYAEAMQLKSIPKEKRTREIVLRYRAVAARHNELVEALPRVEAYYATANAKFKASQKLGGRRRKRTRRSRK